MGRLIYGGTFNPLHVAHLRLAVECAEMLAAKAGHLDFVPAGNPPHKDAGTLLPFDLRAEMVRHAIADMTGFTCNDLEKRRAGPTYTIDTLLEYGRAYPGEDFYFILGSLDYGLLPQWRRGLDLPFFSNLVIAPRGNFSRAEFLTLSRALWPDCEENPGALSDIRFCKGECACVHVPNGHDIFYLPIPWLDISASEIRQGWLCQRDIRWLVPERTLRILREKKELVMEFWQEEIK